jgi:hypothetical protein
MPGVPQHAPGAGRAAAERLCHQRGRLAPQGPALRESHPRAWPPHYGHGRHPGARPIQPGQRWPFLDRRYPAVGETTATLGHEEGPGRRSPGQDTAPEGHLTRCGKDPWNLLTTKRLRSVEIRIDLRPGIAHNAAFCLALRGPVDGRNSRDGGCAPVANAIRIQPAGHEFCELSTSAVDRPTLTTT